jgi:tetratricopeptide (TPR) repeat protein
MLRLEHSTRQIMLTQHPAQYSSKRRSTRVAACVFLRVRGIDENGQQFMEETGTLEVSSRGCKYFSRYSPATNSWLTLELSKEGETSAVQHFRARVAWLRKSRNLRGLFQVGVEFEPAGNVWGLANPPGDWRQSDITRAPDAATIQREMNERLTLAETGTYYQLLRLTSDSSRSQVRHSYYEFVRQFHPDRHMDHPEWTQPLHKLLEVATLAYKTLTDETLRQKYDERLAASGTFTLGRQQNEFQKTAEECMEKARDSFRAQNPGGAILWLRKAAEIEPNSHKYHALLARALSAVAPFRREAVEHFEKALEIDPWSTAVRFQLAELYENMKLPWRARAEYQKVLEMDAGNSKARERLRLLDDETPEKSLGKRNLIDRLFRHSPK